MSASQKEMLMPNQFFYFPSATLQTIESRSFIIDDSGAEITVSHVGALREGYESASESRLSNTFPLTLLSAAANDLEEGDELIDDLSVGRFVAWLALYRNGQFRFEKRRLMERATGEMLPAYGRLAELTVGQSQAVTIIANMIVKTPANELRRMEAAVRELHEYELVTISKASADADGDTKAARSTVG
jgi:hypothetical protein